MFLVLLLVTNFLLYLGAIRRSATELLAWFVAHMLGLLIQVRDILMDIIMVTIMLTAHPPCPGPPDRLLRGGDLHHRQPALAELLAGPPARHGHQHQVTVDYLDLGNLYVGSL